MGAACNPSHAACCMAGCNGVFRAFRTIRDLEALDTLRGGVVVHNYLCDGTFCLPLGCLVVEPVEAARDALAKGTRVARDDIGAAASICGRSGNQSAQVSSPSRAASRGCCRCMRPSSPAWRHSHASRQSLTKVPYASLAELRGFACPSRPCTPLRSTAAPALRAATSSRAATAAKTMPERAMAGRYR